MLHPLSLHPICVVTHSFLPAPSPFVLLADHGHFRIYGGQWESRGPFGNKASLLALCAVIILKNVKGMGARSLPPAVTGSSLQSEQQHFVALPAHAENPVCSWSTAIKSRGLVFRMQGFCMLVLKYSSKFPQFIIA